MINSINNILPNAPYSQLQAMQATNTILTQTFHKIASNQKALASINPYSTQRSISYINQLGNQISNGPRLKDRLLTPKQTKKMKADNCMNVEKIEMKFSKRRGRSKTRFGREMRHRTSFNMGSEGFLVKKKITYNNFSRISNQLKEEKNEEDDEDEKTQQIRQQLKKLQIQQQQKDNNSIKLNTKAKNLLKIKNNYNEKQIFCYQYDGKQDKVKSKQKKILISSQKSLISVISKNIDKKMGEKKKKIQPTFIQTSVIIQKKKSEKKTKKGKKKISITLPQETISKVDVKFSTINDLSSQFECSPGVRFLNDKVILRNKVQSFGSEQIPHHQRRYSQLQFQNIKMRSQSNIQAELNRNLEKQTINPEQLKIFSERKNSLSKQYTRTSPSQQYTQSKNTIVVNDQQLFQDMLIPKKTNDKPQQKINYDKKKQQNINQKEGQSKQISRNDRFNIDYLRQKNSLADNLAKINIQNKKYKRQKQQNDQEARSYRKVDRNLYNKFESQKLSQIEHSKAKISLILELRDPLLRNRERLKNKGILIAQIKKKFQNSLRNQTIE